MAFIFLRSSRKLILCPRRRILIALFCAWIIIALLWFYQLLKHEGNQTGKDVEIIVRSRLLLWWTHISDKPTEVFQRCGAHACTISNNRHLLSQAEVLMFYGSNVITTQLPIPRQGQLWALLHEESPRNMPALLHESFLTHFNFSSTFSRYSDKPLTISYLTSLQELTSPDYVVPIGRKSQLRWDLAPVLYMNSDCFTMTSRNEYVGELMKYISIDSYGICLHNRDLPPSLQGHYLHTLYSPEVLNFIAQYKFVIAIENGVCNDYITEKFWRPLIVGSIPIYLGSPTIRDWEPNNSSVIYVSDFASPKELAKFLLELDGNDTKYNKYMRHKYDQIEPITNTRLREEFLRQTDESNFFGTFECFVCGTLHSLQPGDIHIVNKLHYDCPLPCNNSEFNDIHSVGKCEADILDDLLRKNENFTKQTFINLVNERIMENKCVDYSFV